MKRLYNNIVEPPYSKFSYVLNKLDDGTSQVIVNYPRYFIADSNEEYDDIRQYVIVEADDFEQAIKVVERFGGNISDMDELVGAVNPLSAYGVAIAAYNYPKYSLKVFQECENITTDALVNSIWSY